MKFLLCLLLLFIFFACSASAQARGDTVVTIIKRSTPACNCDSVQQAKLAALIDELERQNQPSTFDKATAVASFLALAGVVYLVFFKKSDSSASNSNDDYDLDDALRKKQ